jgi:hypothetical protein
METRDCPSCTITFRDGLLSIVGDSSANQVAILNTWTGTQVRCDQQEPHTFMGVTAISVRTLDGDDRVGFVSDGRERPTMTPNATFDLGGGNDSLTGAISGHAGPCRLAAGGGAGNDMLTVNFLPEVQAGEVPEVQYQADLEGGAGNDMIMFNASYVPEVQSGHVPEVQFLLNARGGAGDDMIMAGTNYVPEVQTGFVPEVQFHYNLGGGAGNDTLVMNTYGGAPQMLDCTMLGDEGNDSLTANTNFMPADPSNQSEPQFNLDLEGAVGRDVLSYMKHGSTPKHSRATLAGGAGDDIIAVSTIGSSNCLIDTRERIDMNGGNGNDLLTFFAFPPENSQLVLGYSYVLTMHGGLGDDTEIADANYFNGGGETGSILEYGDEGNDQHVLLYAGPYQTLLIDGGDGTDFGLSPASHTFNVIVVNCEF